MDRIIAQVNFRYNCSESKMKEMASELQDEVQQVNGLLWKIWIQNDEKSLAGGIYYFENREVAEAYINGPIGDEMRDHPDFWDLDVTYFDVMEGPSKGTNAPVFENDPGTGK